jgi:glycosyltransferase involved in cell wall biosynthesis
LDRVRREAIHFPVSDFLGGLLGVPYTRLPAPIDVLPPVSRGDALLTVARLGPLKGVDRVLRFAARVGRRVTVVGDGPERRSLEDLAVSLGVEATFTGRLGRAEIPWDGAAAACLFSRADVDGTGAEGLGLVLLEAAARGIPSLGTAVGGIPEAADRVIDPERDPFPLLPGVDAVQSRLAAGHGRARCVATLRRLLASAHNAPRHADPTP